MQWRHSHGLFSLLILACCASAHAAHVELPPYPYAPNLALTVDYVALSEEATQYCALERPQESPVDFYYGQLPLSSLDQLCGPPLSADEYSALLGNLYISGYFGGIWLRDGLNDEAHTAFKQGLERSPDAQGSGLTRLADGKASEAALFRALTMSVSASRYLSTQSRASVAALTDRFSIPGLLYLYGYNRGYIEVLLEYPPAGYIPSPDLLACGSYLLDCQSPEQPLPLLERYRSAIDSLEAPASLRWRQMDQVVQEVGVPSMEDGRAVWEAILSESTIEASIYAPLLSLSVGYLLATDASALAAMTAWAEGSSSDARCALWLQTGLVLWSEAYFMGLASDAPVGTAPGLSCE